jgi:hypothetical protein
MTACEPLGPAWLAFKLVEAAFAKNENKIRESGTDPEHRM